MLDSTPSKELIHLLATKDSTVHHALSAHTAQVVNMSTQLHALLAGRVSAQAWLRNKQVAKAAQMVTSVQQVPRLLILVGLEPMPQQDQVNAMYAQSDGTAQVEKELRTFAQLVTSPSPQECLTAPLALWATLALGILTTHFSPCVLVKKVLTKMKWDRLIARPALKVTSAQRWPSLVPTAQQESTTSVSQITLVSCHVLIAQVVILVHLVKDTNCLVKREPTLLQVKSSARYAQLVTTALKQPRPQLHALTLRSVVKLVARRTKS